MGWVLFAGLLGFMVGGMFALRAAQAEVKGGIFTMSGRAWKCVEVKHFGTERAP